MSKVVYLLGAGASYGKRKDALTEPGVSRIIEGLPVVNEINDEIDAVIDLIRSSVSPEHSRQYEIENRKYSFDEMKSMLIKDFEWLKEESSNHATIDTFARTLLLQREFKNYVRLKYLLCTFFLIEQTIHPFDKRYETFFTNILDENGLIPDDIYIITWNYDSQLGIVYRKYGSGNLNVYEPHELPTQLPKAKVFKINGTASYHGYQGVVPYFLSDRDKDALIERVFKQYEIVSERGFYSDGSLDLLFAWEKMIDENMQKHLAQNLTDAEVLVVIGYTFPFFNRKMDRMIFSNLPSLKKIYIQDPNADSIKEFIGSVMTEEQRNTQLPDIKTIKNISNFFLPPEL